MDDVPGDESALTELMERYQGGDTRAFEELYAILAPQLGRYLRSLARDAALADDLLQETFLQLHRARQSYTPPRPVRPWAYAIARHVFLMSRRSRTRRARHETTAVVELPDAPVPPEVASLGDRDQVRRALAQVSDDHREALVLHHILGLSFREVGRVLGITEGAAKVRAHRGIVTMRRILGHEGASGS
ncbi:MAG: sigma-70 family RNA polymerase sigma factor [Acidobacteriota bacterium]